MPSTRLWDRYIFNTLPLPHTLLFVILLTVTLRIAVSFHLHYGARPVLTLCVVSSLLASISDTLAQTVETIRARAKAAAKSKDTAVLDEIEMNEKTPSPGRESPGGRTLAWTSAERPVEFDFPRMIRFMGFGFLYAPISYTWFGILDRHFPATGFGQVLLRTLVDQVCMSPLGLAVFFTFMTLAEGGGQRALKRKFLEGYLPTLRANYCVWPAVQIINFKFMPLPLQIPFVNTVGVFWNMYLSLENSSVDVHEPDF